MKRHKFCLMFAMLWVCLVMSFKALADDERAKLTAIVDDCIASFEAKSEMLDSKSLNLRRSAMKSCLKAAYCKSRREQLITEMVTNRVAPKPYKVRHYLNNHFNGFIDLALLME